MKKTILRLIFLLITITLLVSLAGCGTTDENTSGGNEAVLESVTPEEGYSLFISTDGNLSFVYSNDWTSQEGSDGVAQVFMAPDGMTRFNYITETLTIEYTLSQYANAGKTQLKNAYSDITFDKDAELKIGSYDAYELEYDLQGTAIRQVFIVKDKVAYIFSFSAASGTTEEYTSVINKMLESIRIK